ncbi:MAG: hypothetical protein DMF59_15220 [Acidobacteria bacterium]|nr:MAG: hypothetical protein DMF59_15220 [Acidobacteriota bacterium]
MARQHLGTAALFLLLAIMMTWPLAPNINRAVAYPEDPYINTWILDWDWYATLHQPLHLFDANAFYPARDSLAFSENLYGIALLLFPFRAAGVPPVAAHNLGILTGFALSGFGAYLLGRLITGSAMAGVAAGVFYAFLPFRFTHLPHVQHVWGGTIPIMLTSLLWYSQKPSWRRASLFAAAFLFNGLCNIHWLLFGSVAIAATVLIVRPRMLPIASCSAIAALILVVFLRPYLAVGMQRTWSEAKEFSALPSDWLRSNFHNRAYAFLRDPNVNPERWLFPGALSLVLGGIALASRDRGTLRIAGVWIGIGVIGSLGLHTIFHRFLFSHVFGFRAIRVPARWAAIAYVGLAMLVAVGSAVIARRRLWLNGLVAIAFLIELWSAPVQWYAAPTRVPPIYRWIAERRPHAIIELPMSPEREYVALLHATAHHVPMVNGISGFAPPEYIRIAALAEQWSDALVDELRRIGVTHIIIHADALDAAGNGWMARAVSANKIALQRRFDDDLLFTITASEARAPSRSSQACSRCRSCRRRLVFILTSV